jgi:hypothetical protein
MSRYALPVFLFLGHIAIVAALTAAVLVRLTDSSRDVHASIHYRAETVAALPSDRPPAPGALLGSPQGNNPSTTQDGTRLRPSESASESEPETPASPARAVPPPDDSAPDPAAPSSPAVHPPSDDQLAALQQLVAQSQQESEQLRLIDNQLTAHRQQMADDESRRQREAELKVARHATTVAALGVLRQAEASLASGNSDGVDDELTSAETALSGRTQLDVEGAREAITRGDLFQARLNVAAALAERRPPR